MGSASPSRSPPPATGDIKIQPSEIIQSLAPYAKDGIKLGDLLRKFRGRIDRPGGTTKSEWIQMVKAQSVFDTKSKLLRPKTGNESPQGRGGSGGV